MNKASICEQVANKMTRTEQIRLRSEQRLLREAKRESKAREKRIERETKLAHKAEMTWAAWTRARVQAANRARKIALLRELIEELRADPVLHADFVRELDRPNAPLAIEDKS
jgi:hypothetical protein